MIDRLFVPLNKEWYKLFISGKKKWEMRGYSPRFNEKTVKVGRSVELRKGYMKEGAIWGVITELHITNNVYELPLKVIEELFPIPPSSLLWEYIQWYNTKYNKFIVFNGDDYVCQMNSKDVRIQELEDALVEERARALWFEGDDPCDPPNLDWKTEPNDIPESVRLLWGESARQQLQAEGKIGPDARPKCDHAWQAAIEERGYQTCLKCGECRNIEDIPRTAPAWQITEDRVTAIDQGLRFLEWSNAKTGSVETKKRIAILKTMLEEASDKRNDVLEDTT